jgi:hypothetical protein
MFVTSSQLHFRWPTSDGPKASFQYQVYSDTATPKVGWLNKDGIVADKSDGSDEVAYIDAPQCTSGQLPAPYGSLSQVATASATQIKVNTSAPAGAVLPVPQVPFPIIIGSERMRVDSIQGTTWLVTRVSVDVTATGNTEQVRHPAGALVMSTPLPLLSTSASVAATFMANGVVVTHDPPLPSPYVVYDQAQMCIVPGYPIAQDFDPTTTWLIRFLDIGDGWVAIGKF